MTLASRMFYKIAPVILALTIVYGPALAQDEVLLDIAVIEPNVMEVDRVDLRSGVVVFDGEEYRIDAESFENRSIENRPGPALDPSNLAAGVRAYVLTDGTEPGRGHRPTILGLWWAQ